MTHLSKGDLLWLGCYPQGPNGEILPIKWRVLKTLPGRVLVLADQVLDFQPFHTENRSMRYEHASLRDWLLNEFCSTAFTDEEAERIFQPENREDPGGDLLWALMGMETLTESYIDPVFLLGDADISELFPSENTLFCPGAEAEMTPWAKKRYPEVDDMDECVCWWLRSSSRTSPMAFIVSPVASVGMSAVRPDNLQGVRPAMWVRLKDEEI